MIEKGLQAAFFSILCGWPSCFATYQIFLRMVCGGRQCWWGGEGPHACHGAEHHALAGGPWWPQGLITDGYLVIALLGVWVFQLHPV